MVKGVKVQFRVATPPNHHRICSGLLKSFVICKLDELVAHRKHLLDTSKYVCGTLNVNIASQCHNTNYRKTHKTHRFKCVTNYTTHKLRVYNIQLNNLLIRCGTQTLIWLFATKFGTHLITTLQMFSAINDK